jgi:hypothetical protein
LTSKDAGGFSDPICALFGTSSKKPFAELGRTEYLMNTHNPKFKKTMSINYVPGDGQQLEFRIYDVDCLSSKEVVKNVISNGMEIWNEVMNLYCCRPC